LAAAWIPLRVNPNRSRTAFGSAARSWWAAQYARQRAAASRCSARHSRNTASQCRSSRRRIGMSEASSSSRMTDTGPLDLKFGAFDLPRRRGPTTPEPVALSVGMAAMGAREPHTTDNKALPRRHRNPLPLTGLSASQVNTVTLARQRAPPAGYL
jgi:hypothetical protein